MAMILSLNPDVEAIDDMGRTALHFAARQGNEESFKVLTNKYNELDLYNDPITIGGVTPLMNAIQSGNVTLVNYCLNQNMNPFLKDGLDRTAFEYAKPFK